MKVSVIIPLHNCEPWVENTLKSIAAQAHQPHEIIVVDDSSTDRSVEKVQRSGVPVTLLHVAFRNAAAARNVGIETATGDWVAFLDADDEWYPHHLQRACELLSPGKDAAYLGHRDFLYEGTTERVSSGGLPLTEPAQHLTHEEFFGWFADTRYYASSGLVARRSAVLDGAMFDPSQVRRHDIDMFLRLIHGRTWTYNPVPSWCYRVGRPGAISASRASCEFYFLRAMARNRQRYDGAAMDAVLARASRVAVGAARRSHDQRLLADALALAQPYLGWHRRLAYAAVAWWAGRGNRAPIPC